MRTPCWVDNVQSRTQGGLVVRGRVRPPGMGLSPRDVEDGRGHRSRMVQASREPALGWAFCGPGQSPRSALAQPPPSGPPHPPQELLPVRVACLPLRAPQGGGQPGALGYPSSPGRSRRGVLPARLGHSCRPHHIAGRPVGSGRGKGQGFCRGGILASKIRLKPHGWSL